MLLVLLNHILDEYSPQSIRAGNSGNVDLSHVLKQWSDEFGHTETVLRNSLQQRQCIIKREREANLWNCCC